MEMTTEYRTRFTAWNGINRGAFTIKVFGKDKPATQAGLDGTPKNLPGLRFKARSPGFGIGSSNYRRKWVCAVTVPSGEKLQGTCA